MVIFSDNNFNYPLLDLILADKEAKIYDISDSDED